MARDSDGKVYYFNELTGETSWQFPSAPPSNDTLKDDMTDNMAPLATGDVVEPQQGGAIASEMTMGTGTMVGVQGARGAGRTLGDIFTVEGLPKLYLLLGASVVLLVQAWIHLGQTPHDGAVAYALAVSIVSLGVTGIFILYGRYKTDDFVTKTVKVRGTTYTLPQMYAVFITIWWTFGAFILTFYAPYSVPSNAYLACWLGFVSSSLYAAGVFTRVEHAFRSFQDISLAPSLTALAGCVVAAAVVFFVALGNLKFWTGSFALIASIIDFVLAGVTYFCIDTKRFGPQQVKAAAAALVIMWALCIFFLTFDLDVENEMIVLPSKNETLVIDHAHMSAFTKGGNGFIATWAGMLCAFAFAYHERYGAELDMKRTLRQSFSLRQQEGAMQPAEVV